jgi:hypothetical protein
MAHATDYQTLGTAAATVGWLVSATAAVIFTFKGRARWEPSEQDVAAGPQKTVGLLTAVGVGFIWERLGDSVYDDLLARLAIDLALGCFVFLIVYTVLVSTRTYIQEYIPAANHPPFRRIIGGFCLTDAAKGSLRKQPRLTVQDLLRNSGNDPDKVWKPFYRALAKLCFVAGYLGLTICGSVALTSAAILSLPREQVKVVEESSGSRLSGIGETWSPWYSVDVGRAVKGYTLDKARFWLTGDRQCNKGAECKEASKNDSGVTELFRLKGRAGSPSPLPSEGHLQVTYKPLPGEPSFKPVPVEEEEQPVEVQ